MNYWHLINSATNEQLWNVVFDLSGLAAQLPGSATEIYVRGLTAGIKYCIDVSVGATLLGRNIVIKDFFICDQGAVATLDVINKMVCSGVSLEKFPVVSSNPILNSMWIVNFLDLHPNLQGEFCDGPDGIMLSRPLEFSKLLFRVKEFEEYLIASDKGKYMLIDMGLADESWFIKLDE